MVNFYRFLFEVVLGGLRHELGRTSVYQDAEGSKIYWKLRTTSATNTVGYWNNTTRLTQRSLDLYCIRLV